MPKRRGRGKPFAEGNQAAKGHGRPKGSSYVAICQKWADEKGWRKLIDLADGKDYKVGMKDGRILSLGPDLELQFQATKLLIEYGFGRPKQAVDVSGTSSVNLYQIIREAEEDRGLPSSFDD